MCQTLPPRPMTSVYKNGREEAVWFTRLGGRSKEQIMYGFGTSMGDCPSRARAEVLNWQPSVRSNLQSSAMRSHNAVT